MHISPSCFRKGENMNIKHFNIMVTDQECGHARESGNPADLTAYLLDRLPHKPELLRPAVVLCPGGGYGFVSPREDQPVAMEFLAAGCQVFSLHYSVAPETFPVALMELAKAVALVKSHACEWNIDTERIMVCGFSAGGHLAACLGMMWNRDFLYGPLNMAPEDMQPKGMILCYPVITSGEFGHKRSFEQLLGGKAGDPRLRELVSLELQAGPHTPRTFLWHTWTVRACRKLSAAGPGPEKGRRKPGNAYLSQRTPRTVPGYGGGFRQHRRLPCASLSGLDGTGKRMDKRKGQGMIC